MLAIQLNQLITFRQVFLKLNKIITLGIIMANYTIKEYRLLIAKSQLLTVLSLKMKGVTTLAVY